MQVNKIYYEKVFPLAPYVNEKIGIEVTIGDDEMPERALSYAKVLAETWHKESNPDLYIEPVPGIDARAPRQDVFINGSPILPSIDYKAKEKLEIAIDNATTIEELAACKGPASQCGLITQYMNRLKQLS